MKIPLPEKALFSRDENREKLQSIQIMRGLAAIAVVIYHTHIILAQPRYGSIDIFGSFASKGWLGVNVFFLLSGFIILHAHARDIGRPGKLAYYLWKRVSRVYPIYWVFLTFYILAARAGLGSPDFSWNSANITSAYLLTRLTHDLSLPLQVAWTLFYEINFYILFAVLILNRYAGVAVFCCWLGAIVIANAFFGVQPTGILHVWNLYFLGGMLVFLINRRMGRPQFGVALLAIGLILLIAVATTLPEENVGELQQNSLLIAFLIIPIAMIMLGSMLVERNFTIKYPAALIGLGNASYSIYLVHSAIISLLAILKVKFAISHLPEAVVFIAVMLISVMSGIVAHLLVEKPLLSMMRGWRAYPKREYSGKVRDIKGME